MDTGLRDTLRRRAGARCEYCHLPERFATLRFQQDHVISQKHRGPAALANLAWSCADCNAHKGSDLAGIDAQTGKLERLFNPRTDDWGEHFKWNGAELVGKTAIGRVTVAVLQVNREERVAVRRELMAAHLHPPS
jgi:hypothetical protein